MRKRVASGSTPDAVGARPTTRFSGGRECWSSTTAYSVRTTGAASVELPSDEQATLGGRDVVDTVRELLGSVSHFDFQQVGRDLPRVDVPDLERFFTLAVGRHRRRVFKHANGLEIKAPETWKLRSYAVRDRYDGLVFNRDLRGANAASRVLGVGHTLFDIALDEARNLPARLAVVDGISAPVLVVAVEDEVTGTGSLVQRLIFGVTDIDGRPAPLRDWELLQLLNGVSLKGVASRPAPGTASTACAALADRLKNAFESGLSDHAPALRRPVCWPEMLFVSERFVASDGRAS